MQQLNPGQPLLLEIFEHLFAGLLNTRDRELTVTKGPQRMHIVTGQGSAQDEEDTFLNPPRQILKLDLGPMPRSLNSIQNF